MIASEGHLRPTGLQDPHQGTLTAADVNWLTGLQHDLGSVKTVVAVRDLGRSADQQAEQLQVLSNVGGCDETGVTNLVKDLRAQIAKAGPTAGLQMRRVPANQR